MKTVFLSDQTLKNWQTQTDAPLLFREKIAVAENLDRLGFDAIELASLQQKREDAIVVKTIADQVANAELCLPVALSADGVAEAWACLQGAAKPCLQVCVPTSAVTMEYQYHKKESAMLELVGAVCEQAKACCAVELVAEDATRADPAFLQKLLTLAEQAGVSRVTLSDDVGTLLPTETAALVREAAKMTALPIHIQIKNTLHLACANALAALGAGAVGVKVALVGDDALNTVDFASAVRARGDALGFAVALQMEELHSDVKTLLKGLHRDAAEKRTETDDKGVFLDAESTVAQVAAAAESLGYTLSAQDVGEVHKALLQVCARKSSVGAKELEALIASSASQAPSTYHLESFTITTSNVAASVAHLVLTKSGEKIVGVAAGDGPIDAAFRAIDQCVGYHYELDDFQIQAVTEGKEALGAALVRLREGGKLYSGNGLSADIVGASIRAYLNALNKTVANGDTL